MTLPNAEIKEILMTGDLFRGLQSDEIENLLKGKFSDIRHIKKGEFVFREGDKADKFYIFLSGYLLVSQDTLGGKRLILTRIVTPGDMFGEIYPFMGAGEYDMYVEAIEDSVIFEMDLDVVYSGFEGKPGKVAVTLQKNLISIFAQKAYVMNRRLRVLGASGIRGKIARFLIQRQKANEKMINSPEEVETVSTEKSKVQEKKIWVRPREEMADFLNVTRPALSREISAMVEEGIIRAGQGYLVILDQEALEEYL